MAPSSRPEGHLNINLSSLSPIVEPTSSTSAKSPFGLPKSSNGGLSGLSSARIGAGSPSHEQTSRLYPKRTRELQTPTGVSLNIWGPPTSGTSTPLFEIPESPNQDGFPDLMPPATETSINSPARRARAGTLPSRISPAGVLNSLPTHTLTSKTSRPTPSTSPFRPSSTSAAEDAFNAASTTASNNSTLLSRLRAGSMPQRANHLNSSGPIGQSAFSSGWGSRGRAATLTSIQSADDPSSPPQSSLGKDGLADPGVRTLDYLGLAETSYPADMDSIRLNDLDTFGPAGLASLQSDLNSRVANRFRSFSVNTQPQYANNGQDNTTANFPGSTSGTLTPSAAAALEAEYEAVQERVRLHNQAVQAFALNANAARPRARTAGLVETPQRNSLRRYGQLTSNELGGHEVDPTMLNISADGNNIEESLYNLQISDSVDKYENPDEVGSQISRSLWIGSIPNSTTVSSLDAIFAHYGTIESTRVLTHKNCGFVNFESVHDAVCAKQVLNGKEIFPGAGPVRIGFAKAPNSSMSQTPAQASQSPTSDPARDNRSVLKNGDANGLSGATNQSDGSSSAVALSDLQSDILQIIVELGAQQSDLAFMSGNIESAASYQTLQREIPPIPEPSANRVFDAPRLRDVRKRIDNGTCGIQEIEQIAIEMLPEIAELSSDYLGNTVVQKLFEFCSEATKEEMLRRIAPHIAEIGIHKNGTWAAQKIIEVCKAESQVQMIVDHLRPYTIPLFLDQYGNYVLQCCLKFGSPYNDFIFETMLSRLWEVAQGRFGARAMRACLESHHATKNQLRMMAAVISLHSVQLATNTNGALLLTWLLDTCTFPRRRTVLAPYLVPHLVQLCTHKVAYLTVLKVVNQRNEPEAREIISKALFFSPNDTTLEQILSDQTSGVTLIFKIITNPFLDETTRPEIVQNIARVLDTIKAQPNQGYKRLMDEVGLSSRPVQPALSQYPGQIHAGNDRGKMATHTNGAHYPGNYPGNVNAQAFDSNINSARSGSSDSFGYPYVNSFPTHQPNYGNMPFQQMTPQSQYSGFQRNNGPYMPSGYAGYASTPPSMDAFRGGIQNTGSPLPYHAQMSPLMNAGSFQHQGYPQSNGHGSMYNYAPSPTQNHGYYYGPPMQAVHSGGRGRRLR